MLRLFRTARALAAPKSGRRNAGLFDRVREQYSKPVGTDR